MQVDCHSHILPGVDDGARTLEQSLVMARVAVAQGTDRMFATPHGYTSSFHVDPHVILEKTRVLHTALQEAQIPLKVLPGMEVHHFVRAHGGESEDLLRLQQQSALGLGGYRNPRHVLLEFSFDDWPRDAGDTLRQCKMAGIQVVLAHPERYIALQKSPDLIEQALEQGAWMQLTSGSILGRFGSKAQELSRLWLSQGYIHIVASDAHGPTRPPGLQEAYDHIEREWGLGEWGQRCQDNAESIWETALSEMAKQA
ncbi:MAG: tyrosine protein phosphatase [Firmicutes bacterium]|nr:tyrosine protein phosphatase [Bacillota bacterium]